MLSRDRIHVALDVDHPSKALELVKVLGPIVGFFKIGLELITAMLASVLVSDEEEAIKNMRSVRELFRLLGLQFFWDGKFDDIPNTVGAVSKIVGQTIKVGMFNVHASCGVKGMMAAMANKGGAKAFAVTVLTSHEENNAHLIFGAPTKAKALQFARDAKIVGLDGVICSPQELVLLNDQPELLGLGMLTPGIRSLTDPPDDQNRTMSARDAAFAGATGEVIGRPITKAASPYQAALDIAEEISIGLRQRLHMSLLNLAKIKFGAFKLKLHEKTPDAPLSPIYLNIRELPDWLYTLAGDVLHDLADREEIPDFDYVIGIPKAGEPIGKAFAKAVGKPHLRIEKVETDEGRRITSTILDPFEKGKKVVLIDDLVTQADTKREAIMSVEANGLEVAGTLVLYDRERGGLKVLNDEGHKTCAAARLSETLEFFVGKRKIDAAKMAEVMAYVAAN